MTTAVVPLRGPGGKTRLAEFFGERQRDALVAALARHVTATLLAAGAVDDVVVVTRDPTFATAVLSADPRLTILPQPDGEPGLNAAVALGGRLARARGATRLLVIHTDLPLLTIDDVRALLAPATPVVLAPDGAGQGTNALALAASLRGFSFRFGVGSRAAHAAQAATRGLATAVVQRPGTATDLDTPADWASLPDTVRERLTSPRGARPLPAAYGAAWSPSRAGAHPAPGDRR